MIKRRMIQGLLILALLCGAVLLAHPTAAWALAGSGTQEAPYQIGSAADLQAFADKVNNNSETTACAVLMGDIVLNTGLDQTKFAVDNNGTLTYGGSQDISFDQWTPIGNGSNPYTGTFDGAGHEISGMYINSSEKYVGLFGCIGSGGTVKNLTLADSTINSSNSSADSSSEITAYVGGICGYNAGGSITNCSNSGNVSSSANNVSSLISCVGGICGYNDGGSITNCSNSGAVSGTGTVDFIGGVEVGGICGRNAVGSITNCYWLEGTAGAGAGVGSSEATKKSEDEYASGEVAWLLNQRQTDKPWGQGSNDRPVLISNCPEGVTIKTPVRITIEMQNDETTEQYGYTTAGSTLASYPNNYIFFEDDQYSTIIDKATKTFDKDTTIYAQTASTVTSIALNKTTLALYVNDTEQLTATVAPENANGTILWTSSDSTVATVDSNGSVHAVGAGTATITAAAASDSSKNAACTVTVTESVYGITADTTTLYFGSVYTGYAQPAAQTVTLTNTGNRTLTLTQPASTNRFEVGTLSMTNLAAGETATFTVQPKAGLAAGTYSETIEVTSTEGAAVTISASFTVKSRPSYNPPTVSEETIDAIADAQPGETVTVDLSSGSTKLDKEVFETLAGKDVTLVVDLGDGVSWTVKGSDVPEDADFTDIDMGVTMNSDGIPVEVVNAITGERSSVQITLAHDGAFGFTMTLTAPLGAENAGYWANLYHFDEAANAMTFETAAPIGSDGSVSLALSHASQYAIVIDDHNHGVVTLPFTDVREGDWFYDPVCYVYSQGLMTGTSATTFEPNISLSRAMLVAVLHRLEGSPAASAGDFTDVAEGDWYAQAVNWAASVGVVNGFDDGTFQPNAAITREQLAAVLRNYAAYKGLDVSASGSLSTFTDAARVSDWAKESVEWAVGSGLLGGYEDSTLQPQGTTTRAEVASVLQRYLEK